MIRDYNLSFKIGSIILPIWKGSIPLQVIGHQGCFVKCMGEGKEILLFPSEISRILIEETRDDLINKIIEC